MNILTAYIEALIISEMLEIAKIHKPYPKVPNIALAKTHIWNSFLTSVRPFLLYFAITKASKHKELVRTKHKSRTLTSRVDVVYLARLK